jgi:flagellin-like hook-associated protein FlgL
MISINVNSAASGAGLNLGKSNEALQKSLSRLSSGRRIVNSSDDAGGLAVSMKMAAAQKRTEATAINLRNIQSYLDTQDGAFKVADKVLSRMSELTTLARDVTKNSGDVENYDKEFQNLQLQLISLGTEKFNGVALFDTSSIAGSAFTVPTSEDGSQSTTVTKSAMGGDPYGSPSGLGYAELSVACEDRNAELSVACDNRTDELRLLGNGVVPATCSLAFRTLLYEAYALQLSSGC